MNEIWQVCFRVEGLRAPIQNILIDDNFLVRGTPTDSAFVYLKVMVQSKEEKDELHSNSMKTLSEIIQVYGLVSNVLAIVPPSSISTEITEKNPFGKEFFDMLTMIAIPTEEQRQNNIPLIQKAIRKYYSIKELLAKEKNRFLRNAIDYYYRALGDSLLEEKLIDLMIAFESLFAGEAQELHLRYSLRAAYFLSIIKENNFSLVFENVYDLYDKRSKVIHGTKDVALDSSKISIFQGYVCEAIRYFIHLEIQKNKILRLLDKSVYDEKSREELNQVVLKAIQKW